MVPRTDIINIFIEDSFDDIISYTLNEQLTRYPVCKGNKDNVIGFIHVKDLYKQKIEGNGQDINNIIREIKLVPESMLISELLKIFKKEKVQVALIIDEYGDILEEIVGEIQDEFDEEEDAIIKTEDNSYIVDGKVLIEDITELLYIDIQDENIDTIGGWAYIQLESYPQVNDKFTYKNYEFIILKCDRKRINKLLIKDLSDK